MRKHLCRPVLPQFLTIQGFSAVYQRQFGVPHVGQFAPYFQFLSACLQVYLLSVSCQLWEEKNRFFYPLFSASSQLRAFYPPRDITSQCRSYCLSLASPFLNGLAANASLPPPEKPASIHTLQ
jgi:hypothetical protein